MYFRHSTRREARRLNIQGIARNLPDGSVEVIAHADPAAVEELRAWLQHGPPEARVQEVRETAPDDAQRLPRGFEVF